MVGLTVAEAGWFHSAVDRLTQRAEYQPDFDPLSQWQSLQSRTITTLASSGTRVNVETGVEGR